MDARDGDGGIRRNVVQRESFSEQCVGRGLYGMRAANSCDGPPTPLYPLAICYLSFEAKKP
jgi:hypothetical protein